jgi:hypothetical protein
MKPRSRSYRVTATVLAALVLPVSAAAQYRLPAVAVAARADSLHMAALILAQTSHRWREAARLHEQSAALRPAEDPFGFRCLSEAAQLRYSTAWIAQEQGKSRQVWELGRRAEILAASPLLSDVQRSLLFRRIEHTSAEMTIRP